jgi:hypothetical protein
MGWRDKVFGKTAEPRGETTAPPPRGRWGQAEDATNEAGRSAKDLLDVLRGKAPRAQQVCREGHASVPGSNTCPYGHYVG